MKDFSRIASSLTRLTRKGMKFIRNNACEEAFQLLKTHLTLAPILIIPKSDINYAVYCVASLSGLGYVLMQEGKVDVCSSS